MIKAIIFDLGKVIVPFDLKRGYAALQPHCACPVGEIPKRLAATDLVARFESGQVSPRDFVEQLSAMLDLKVGYAQFCELWSSIFLPEALITEDLVERLRRRYRTLLLSNTNAIHFQMIRDRYPVLRHFDDFVLSYEVGALKPDARIYEEAIARARCGAGECFFTDDMPPYVEAARRIGIDAVPYVEAARRIGIDAVQFQSVAQLERELRARGVAW